MHKIFVANKIKALRVLLPAVDFLIGFLGAEAGKERFLASIKSGPPAQRVMYVHSERYIVMNSTTITTECTANAASLKHKFYVRVT